MKLVVTVVGVDRVGIIAGVSTVLANYGVNIMSINQTILDGVFNMIMMCETKSEDMKNLTACLLYTSGHCSTCIDRAKAFHANGVKDPAL